MQVEVLVLRMWAVIVEEFAMVKSDVFLFLFLVDGWCSMFNYNRENTEVGILGGTPNRLHPSSVVGSY